MTGRRAAPRSEEGKYSTPDAVSTTPGLEPGGHSWNLQVLMELQHSNGRLTQAVEQLTKQSEEHAKKLDSISHRIYAAAAVLAVLGTVLAFLLDRAWDKIEDVIATLVAQ